MMRAFVSIEIHERLEDQWKLREHEIAKSRTEAEHENRIQRKAWNGTLTKRDITGTVAKYRTGFKSDDWDLMTGNWGCDA